MNRFRTIWIGLLTLSFILGSCSSPTPAPTPTQSAGIVLTAAAQTAAARIEEATPVPPTATPVPSSPTPDLTQTIGAQTMVAQLTQVALTPSATSPADPKATSGLPAGDNATFTMRETIPDGTSFDPGVTFTKSWRLMNTGQNTWSTSYALVFVSGEQMGGPASVALTLEVPPGQVVDIPVKLTAPATSGSYKGFWRMRNPGGQFFGDLIYVQIVVNGSGTPLPTSAATPVATQGGTSGTVSNVTISVDNASVSGTCPHTFTFTGSFTVNGSATVTYQLEAGGFDNMTLPGAESASFGAGTYSVTYYLEITASGSGWARLRITEPNDVSSDKANISLNCQP